MDTIKLWARNGDAVRQAIELGEIVWFYPSGKAGTKLGCLKGITKIRVNLYVKQENNTKDASYNTCQGSILKLKLL